MKKLFLVLIAICTLLTFSAPSFADATDVAKGQVELLNKMTADGMISKDVAAQATKAYVDQEALNAKSFFTWSNILTVAAVILFLVAFHGILLKVAAAIWFIIAAVPVIVYQTIALAFTVTAAFFPEIIWVGKEHYIGLFGAIANIMVFGWIVSTNEILVNVIDAIAKAIPKSLQGFVPFLVLAAYFGFMAMRLDSQVLGFLTVVAVSAAFGFGMFSFPGGVALGLFGNSLGCMIAGNLLIVGAYVYGMVNHALPNGIELFSAGIEWYATLAVGVGCLIGGSPWFKSGESSPAGYLLLSFVLCIASSALIAFYGSSVISGIMIVCTILLIMEWIMKFGYSNGVIFGSLISGAFLWGLGMAVERWGQMLALESAMKLFQ